MPSPRSILAAAAQFLSDLVQGRDRKAIADLEARVGQAQARRIAGRGGRETEERRGGMRSPRESGESGSHAEPDFKPGENGDFILVSSSNVHSFSYVEQQRWLYVRFLADQGNGNRSGPGPLYRYTSVPRDVFERFKSAGSKGGAVWDELRIRGTAYGHKFDYQLVGAGPDEYVPRKQTGAGLNPREISQDGRILRSIRTGTGQFTGRNQNQ